MLTFEEKETIEWAKIAAEGKVKNLDINVKNSKLIGSFGRKGYSAKDIDILVIVDDARKLIGKEIISSRVDGKNLDIFIEDISGRKGVFEDWGFLSKFKPLNFKVKNNKIEKYLSI